MDRGDGEVPVPEVDGLPLPSSSLCSSPALLSRKKQSGWVAVTEQENEGRRWRQGNAALPAETN
jgi:hypothetical protein